MRVHFSQLFNVSNGAITPKVPVQIGGITMTPGLSFGGGVSFGGVNLSQYVGKDLEVEVDREKGVNIITGVYQ